VTKDENLILQSMRLAKCDAAAQHLIGWIFRLLSSNTFDDQTLESAGESA